MDRTRQGKPPRKGTQHDSPRKPIRRMPNSSKPIFGCTTFPAAPKRNSKANGIEQGLCSSVFAAARDARKARQVVVLTVVVYARDRIPRRRRQPRPDPRNQSRTRYALYSRIAAASAVSGCVTGPTRRRVPIYINLALLRHTVKPYGTADATLAADRGPQLMLLARSRSLYFWILPVEVFGISSKITVRGHL